MVYIVTIEGFPGQLALKDGFLDPQESDWPSSPAMVGEMMSGESIIIMTSKILFIQKITEEKYERIKEEREKMVKDQESGLSLPPGFRPRRPN